VFAQAATISANEIDRLLPPREKQPMHTTTPPLADWHRHPEESFHIVGFSTEARRSECQDRAVASSDGSEYGHETY